MIPSLAERPRPSGPPTRPKGPRRSRRASRAAVLSTLVALLAAPLTLLRPPAAWAGSSQLGGPEVRINPGGGNLGGGADGVQLVLNSGSDGTRGQDQVRFAG